MKFEVLYTDNFARELKKLSKKYRSIKNDLSPLISALENDPVQGIALGNHCYKVRLAISSKGKGKSGGARIITHLYISAQTVYLLSIYDKAEKENLSDTEIQDLLKSL